MVKNSRTHTWNLFALDLVYRKNSLLLLLLSKMVQQKERTIIQKMSRAVLHNKDVARNLWGEAVNTACHTVNRVYFKPDIKKTPYELWKGRKLNVKYFKIFGSICFILKDRKNVGKFVSQSDEGIFLGYSSTSKAYQVYNKRIKKVMETVNVLLIKFQILILRKVDKEKKKAS